MHLIGWLSVLGALARPGIVVAHEIVAAPHVDGGVRWAAEPLVIAMMLLSGALYAAGARRWRSGATAAFAGGWLALGVALVSPLDALGARLFSAHMVQHELLMLVAAPLLVLGRPGAVMLRALPSAWRRAIGAGLRPRRPLRAVWRATTEPRVAWTLHTIALWLWHVPALFDATLRSTAVHALQHASFLGTALVFWWSLLARRPGPGVALASLFTMSMQSGLLGALLTIAERPWYPAYVATTARFGLTPLEDQQLGGLVMWVPASIVYVAAALALLTPSLRERRAVSAIRRMAVPCLLVLLLAACSRDRIERAAEVTGGNPTRGAVVIRTNGCASCHVIPGVAGADASVGPPLERFAGRAYVAGIVPNTADNLVRWIRSPHAIDAATAMPETGLSEQDARDVAAYLYTLG